MTNFYDQETGNPAYQLCPQANRGMRKVRAFKPTPTTPCGVILTSKGEDGVARVRRLEGDSFLRAAGLEDSDLLLDVNGATGGATAIAHALKISYGDIELLVKPQRFPRAHKDPPAWTVQVPKVDAAQSFDSLLTLSRENAVEEIHGAASELDILPGDFVLCIENQPVQNVEQARRAWERTAEVQSVRIIFEAGRERLNKIAREAIDESSGVEPAEDDDG